MNESALRSLLIWLGTPDKPVPGGLLADLRHVFCTLLPAGLSASEGFSNHCGRFEKHPSPCESSLLKSKKVVQQVLMRPLLSDATTASSPAAQVSGRESLELWRRKSRQDHSALNSSHKNDGSWRCLTSKQWRKVSPAFPCLPTAPTVAPNWRAKAAGCAETGSPKSMSVAHPWF